MPTPAKQITAMSFHPVCRANKAKIAAAIHIRPHTARKPGREGRLPTTGRPSGCLAPGRPVPVTAGRLGLPLGPRWESLPPRPRELLTHQS